MANAEDQATSSVLAEDDVDDAAIDAAFEHWTDDFTEENEGAAQLQEEVQLLEGAAGQGQPLARCLSVLALLPKEVLIRIWSFLSVEDLSRSALICKAAKDLSEEPVLWRRLYCARFGKPSQQQGEATWKAQYKHRDAEERVAMEAADADDNDLMGALYKDMQRARRQLSLGRGRVDDTMEVPRSAVQERLAAWRAAHPPVRPGQTARSYDNSSTPPASQHTPTSHHTTATRPSSWSGRQQQPTGLCLATSSNPSTSTLQVQQLRSPAARPCIQAPAARPAALLDQVVLKGCEPAGPSGGTAAAHPPGPLDVVLLPPPAHCQPNRQGPSERTQPLNASHEPVDRGPGYTGVIPSAQESHDVPGSQATAVVQADTCQQQGLGQVQGPSSCPHTDLPHPGLCRPGSRLHGPSRVRGVSRAAGGRQVGARPSGPLSRQGASSALLVGGGGTVGGADQQEAVRPDLEGQGRDAFSWDQIGDHFCCRETGWIHLCDHTCKEAVIDSTHDLWVCPISCRTVDDRTVSEWELRRLAASTHADDEEGVLDHGFRSAYERGYNCKSLKELARVCGFRL